MNNRLRALLEERVNNPDVSVELHGSKLAEIKSEVPHSILIRSAPLDEPLPEFNCVMYALDLVGKIADPSGRPMGRWYADTLFMRALIDRGILKPSNPIIGSLVTWSASGTLKHCGVLIAKERAISKWGIGHLYEHSVLEVPSSFGTELAFYTALESEEAVNQLAQHCGGHTQ